MRQKIVQGLKNPPLFFFFYFLYYLYFNDFFGQSLAASESAKKSYAPRILVGKAECQHAIFSCFKAH